MATQRKVICALDTSNKDEAIQVVKRFSGKIGGFKIGHALTMPYGLSVVDELMQAGAGRIFLDLKFHDIPNSVALAVREAIKHGVWMITLHSSGGPAMMTAAVEEVHSVSEEKQPILLAVSVLTSLDQHILTNHLGCTRTVEEQMLYLSKLAVECGIDGCVTSPEEVKAVRAAIGKAGVIVTPGVRRPGVGLNDHSRSGSATEALADGADYLVIGRGLMDAQDPDAVLAAYGLMSPA
jgi:orotidine-5'-phosphate decarboxylase